MIVGWKHCIQSSAILLRTVPLDHRDTTDSFMIFSVLVSHVCVLFWPRLFLLCWFPLLSRAFGCVLVANGWSLLDVVSGEL